MPETLPARHDRDRVESVRQMTLLAQDNVGAWRRRIDAFTQQAQS
jgi:hypothetical protein